MQTDRQADYSEYISTSTCYTPFGLIFSDFVG